MIPFLDAARIRALLRYEELIPAVEAALVAVSAGRAAQPPRQLMAVEPHGGHFAAMSAHGPGIGFGAKLVTFFPGNAARGLPTHHGLVVLLQPETGAPLAVLDAAPLTEMRTAAASAVATRALAREDAAVLAILGTGAQARAHGAALPLVRRFREIRIWGRSPEKAERLAAELGGVAMRSAEAAVRGADVVVTATPAREPILRGAWLAPGVHVNAVGWSGGAAGELDEDVLRAAFVVADLREAVLRETGCTAEAELGGILAGGLAVPAGQRTVFRSVGLALEDVAAAALMLARLGT